MNFIKYKHHFQHFNLNTDFKILNLGCQVSMVTYLSSGFVRCVNRPESLVIICFLFVIVVILCSVWIQYSSHHMLWSMYILVHMIDSDWAFLMECLFFFVISDVCWYFWKCKQLLPVSVFDKQGLLW